MKLRTRSLLVAAALLACFFDATVVANAQDISESAYQQIRDLLLEKESRTAVQSKLSSSLVYAGNAVRGITTAGVTDLGDPATTLHMGPQGALVIIKGTVSADLLNTIQQLGGRVIYSSAARGSIQARVPVSFIEAMAGRDDVQRISASFPPMHGSVANLLRRVRLPLPGIGKNDAVPYHFDQFLGLSFFIGSLTSQGFITHGANVAATTYGAKGTGVKVGILSDSAEALSMLIGTGDLPAGTLNVADIDTVLNGGPGTSEGTAMMEIVYDLAPGVQLFFASAFNGEDSFADNIRLLRNTYRCDIIADDVSYSDEPPFQDGVIARAVNDVTQDGALYFSSAGNEGNLTNGTSGTWEGDFSPAGAASTPLPAGYTLHSFGASNFVRLTVATQDVTLHWSDPLGNSTNDYDLFILNSAGTAVLSGGSSTTAQTGPGSDPVEEVFNGSGFPANSRIVVVAKAGAQIRALHIGTFGGRLSISTSGETHGHNAPAGCVLSDPSCTGRAFGVAAVAWNSARGATRAFVGGASNPTETFSSDGPRRMFYKADGTPITPSNFLFGSNGGISLVKPDVSAADGVTTRTPGFSPFFGTSAAAPHAAGVAAIVKSAKPSATGADIFNALTTTTLDIRAPGIDRDSGYGIVMAPAAVNAILH